jgi:hypothetical protein
VRQQYDAGSHFNAKDLTVGLRNAAALAGSVPVAAPL